MRKNLIQLHGRVYTYRRLTYACMCVCVCVRFLLFAIGEGSQVAAVHPHRSGGRLLCRDATEPREFHPVAKHRVLHGL